MKFIQVEDCKDLSHIINVENIVQIIDAPNGYSEITLSNGNLIVCSESIYSDDILRKITKAMSPEEMIDDSLE